MSIRITACAAFLGLAACAVQVPDSNPNAAGVGFDGYDAYQTERIRREAELQAMRRASVTPEAQVIAAETMTALRIERPIGGTAPVAASAAAPSAGTVAGTAPVQTAAIAPAQATAPATVQPNNPGISDEQSFDAVSSRESIASDAERLARNRQQYQIVQPTAVPTRDGSGGPNIVAFALSTTHPLGTPMFERSGRVNLERFNRVCASYGSNDQAQEAFLANGGPERDRKGMDPDGDGFACYWDPSPFRSARGG